MGQEKGLSMPICSSLLNEFSPSRDAWDRTRLMAFNLTVSFKCMKPPELAFRNWAERVSGTGRINLTYRQRDGR